jgi:hypothetical protein
MKIRFNTIATIMIVFYGAEFTRAYITMFSGKAPPSKIARREKSQAVT